MKVRAVSCVGCLLASACLFPGLDGLSGSDASVDSSADAPMDAASETSSEAAACGDGGALFCDKLCTTPTFCDDFDHDLVFGAWTGTTASSGGNVTYDLDAGASAPRSARCTTPGSSGTEQVYAALQHDFAGASRVVLDFDVLVQQPASSADTGLFQYTLYPIAPYDYATAEVRIQSTYSVEQITHLLDGGYLNNGGVDTDAGVVFGAWQHVQLDMDFGGKTARLSVDGKLVATLALTNGFVPGSQSTLNIGQFYANAPTPPWNVHIDDVVVNVTP